jgi:chromosome partitioning protein
MGLLSFRSNKYPDRQEGPDSRGHLTKSPATTFIAVSNRRGGVGKTTVTMMLAYGLSVGRRQKILLVDLDAQASTSIVMMGHQKWRSARESNRTTSGMLAQIANNNAINYRDYITQEIGDVTFADGSRPTLDIIPSTHDLDDKEVLMMIAQQAYRHKVSDAFVEMQERMRQTIRSMVGTYDQVVIDCAPGLSQLVWGALRAADIVFIPYIPDRTAEDNVGWLIQRLKAMEHQKFLTIANRVSGHDSRAQGIVSAIGGRYSPLGVQIPAAQALATALDHRDQPGTLASKFGSAAQYVNALTDAALDAINWPMPVPAE